MAELRSLLKPGENVKLYAVTIDGPEQNRKTAERIASDGKGAVNFPILTDPGHKVIDAYGLRNAAQDGKRFDGIPHATTCVIDKKGKITWMRVDEDYSKRPSNEEIRAALDALK